MLQTQLLIGSLIGGLASGASSHRSKPATGGWPVTTVIMATLLFAAFAAQMRMPWLLPGWQRSPALIEQAEVWRALTALFVQDGGLAGFLFNIVVLLALGSMAENRWGARRWLAIYLGGGIVTQFLALAWQPVGAGNSIACLALAGGLAADFASRRGGYLGLAVRLAAIAGAAGLLVHRDIHGIGFLAGAVLELARQLHARRQAGVQVAI